MNQVLVLNQNYQAITVCKPERAIVLVLLRKADLVSDVAHLKMRSVRQEFDFPSVIRLKTFVRLPFKKVSLTRENVFKRDGYQCAYCGSNEHLTLDHVIPRAKGGKTTWSNLITACYKCNSAKGDSSLQEVGLELSHRPFRPSFIMYMSRFSGRIQEDWKPFLFM